MLLPKKRTMQPLLDRAGTTRPCFNSGRTGPHTENVLASLALWRVGTAMSYGRGDQCVPELNAPECPRLAHAATRGLNVHSAKHS